VVLAILLAGCGAASPRQASNAATLPYPATAGPPVQVGADAVQILPRGSTAFPVILSLIASATHAVDAEMYEFGRDDIASALLDAQRRGVLVTLIVDPSVATTRATATRLRASGIDVVDYPVRKQMIDHVKLLVVDASVAVVGGINWGTTSDRNHDVDARISGPAAVNLERVFKEDLLACGRTATVPPSMADDHVLVAATLPQADIRPLVTQLIDSATSTLDLELFVLTDAGVVHAIESAHARGVAVRVMLDPGQRPSDAAAARLEGAGVALRRYRTTGEKLHAKLAVADGRTAIFGSANWTSGGFQRNHEVDVEILDAPAVAAQFTALVDADWSASAP
jgi:phosphatidylserine/phosphatidylglycerophosphate/cardiolipin synthase-like enzyme